MRFSAKNLGHQLNPGIDRGVYIYIYLNELKAQTASGIQGWKRWCWSLVAAVLVLLVVRGTLSGETCLHWLIFHMTGFKGSRNWIDWEDTPGRQNVHLITPNNLKGRRSSLIILLF